MTLDPRTPVVVGVGQVTEPGTGDEPVDLITRAAERAGADAGGRTDLSAVDAVRILHVLGGRYRDPARLVADRLGATSARTTYAAMGGHIAQALIADTAARIATGELDAALVGGGESWPAYWSARATFGPEAWTTQDRDVRPDESFGRKLDMSHDAEQRVGLVMPVQYYPLADVALRAADGIGVDAHRDRVADLWAGFSRVAADNPHAWDRTVRTAAELRDPSPGNRMVGFPYTKRMNSNHNVAMAAVVLVTSVERARAFGVAPDRWVFPHAATRADDRLASERTSLARSPSMEAAGGAALDLAGIGPDELGPIDLYSCFPSAVQLGARALGLGLDRPLTVTGGMSFAGGPWNNATTHAVATIVERLRAAPEEWALVSGNGGMVGHASYGVYRGRPPTAGFRREDLGPADDGARPVAADHDGPATVETYTVMHDRTGAPETAFVALLTADGARTWATTSDAGDMAALVAEEYCGRRARVDGGTIHLDPA